MKLLSIPAAVALFAAVLFTGVAVAAEQKAASATASASSAARSPTAAPARSPKKPAGQRPVSLSRYRGWDYLVGRLRAREVQERDIVQIYQNPKMPKFSPIPFALAPREKPEIYRNFAKPTFSLLGANFARQNSEMFDSIEQQLQVPREVVSAILVIESGIGKNTGNELVVYRLSRLASVCDPNNLRFNYTVQKKKDSSVTFSAVKERCGYLETTFLPEIPALIEIGKRNKISPLKIRGSSAGAFGLPQFLPSAFLRFGVDGDRNGFVSLHHPSDAAWSAANYLSSYGYRDDIPVEEKRAVIWRYNKSDAYIDTVLSVSDRIRQELSATPTPAILDAAGAATPLE